MMACQRAWGSPDAGWTFCLLPKGHSGPCSGCKGPKPLDVKFRDEQPEYEESIRKQAEREQRDVARRT